MLSLLVGIVIYAMAFALVTSCYRYFSAKQNGSSARKESSETQTLKRPRIPFDKFSFFLLLAAVLALSIVTRYEQTGAPADSQMKQTMEAIS